MKIAVMIVMLQGAEIGWKLQWPNTTCSYEATSNCTQAVGMDTTDWVPPNSKRKYKLLVMMDPATHFKVVTIFKEFGLNDMQTETSKEILDAVCKCWLADKPKMLVLIPDNAGTMIGHLAQFSVSLTWASRSRRLR